MPASDSLPTDLAAAHAMIIAQRDALMAAEARASAAESEAQYRALLIEKRRYTIRKLRHERFGQSSEHGALLAQLELQLADLEEDAAQAEAARMEAAAATSEKIVVPSFERRWPARRPLPEHLPRERIVYPAPSTCPCCGGGTLRKIGEDVTETLELIPSQWKVIQHVNEKFSCRACEAITQPPAPSHPIARGRAGPKLLAHVLFSKYSLHLPLNRHIRPRRHRSRGVDARRLGGRGGSNADAAGDCDPDACLCGRTYPFRRHHRAGPGKGQDPHRPIMDLRARRPAFCRPRSAGGGVFLFARSWRRTSRATFGQLCRIDAGGRLCRLHKLYEANRKPAPIVEAACWAHARRKFFDLAQINKAPIAIEAVERIDVLFAIEREINGMIPKERVRVRNERSRSLVIELQRWLREQRAQVSKNSETGKAIDYSLKRWSALTRFLEDGRLCMSNNAAERELRAIAVGRRNLRRL
jgi:transposase